MDIYSRIVSLLKILLPVAALALLSSLFLISERIQTGGAIPFAQADLTERLRDQQLTAPFFSGTLDDGHGLTIAADYARPSSAANEAANAADVEAELRMLDGGRLLMLADQTTLTPGGSAARFTGNVRLISSQNMRITTERLDTSLTKLHVTAPDTVDAIGPFGTLNAGAMEIFTKTPNGPAHIVFTNKVKVIYDPSPSPSHNER